MKIAMACPYDMSCLGGVQKIVRELGSKLRERGHEVKFVSVLDKNGRKIPDCDCFGQAITTSANGSLTSFDISSIFSRNEIQNYFAKEKFDLLCIHEPVVPFLNWELLNLDNVTKIGWFHSTGFVDLLEFPQGMILEPLQQWIETKLAGSITISTTSRQAWRKAFSKGGVIISGGVDVAKYEEAKPAKLPKKAKINVLFVGRLDERKGVIQLLQAFPQIARKVDAKLWVVGDGPQRQEAKNLAKSLKIEDRVVFLGKVKDEDLYGYYKACDIYCAPSIGGESLGVVLLEAMAAKCPIVAYGNPGYKFTLNGYPWEKGIVKPKSWKKLAEAIVELAQNPKLRESIRSWEGKRVTDFSWDTMADKFMEYATKVIKTKEPELVMKI